MDAAQLEHRARRLVDRLRDRGVFIWPSASGAAIFMTPLARVGATERAFAAANPAAIAAALQPDAALQRVLDHRAACLARLAARRARPMRPRRAKAEARPRRRFFAGMGA